MSDGNNYLSDADPLFMMLVMNFHSTAMIGMGKVIHPLEKKIVRNLKEAQYAIDTLDMLAKKTKGNLTQSEDQYIQHVMRELRLNFVQESGKPEPAKERNSESEEKDKKESEKNTEKD